MWNELLVALALVLVIEGILPFLNPEAYKRFAALMAQSEPASIRWTGLASMAIGLLLLFIVR